MAGHLQPMPIMTRPGRVRPSIASGRQVYYNSVMRVRQKQNTTLSVRLSQEEEGIVRRMARQQQSTVSDVIRDAVMSYDRNGKQRRPRPYDEIEDLIGSVPGLPPDLSDSSGERFAEILRQKAARTR